MIPKSNVENEKLKIDSSMLSEYVCPSRSNESNLVSELKTTFETGYIIPCFTLLFTLISMDTKRLGYPNISKWLHVLCDEKYDENWYIDNGCSHHMTGMKECLRDFKNLANAGVGKFWNDSNFTIKGYGKIKNGKFTIKRVAFVEGLKQNLISVW